ncbi:hypothetical protein [Granulicella arctica]|uniref:Uncharacterized protein n=1 Tax=Granulicella arctica TaxID=940613 RepID=A0A7Y9PGJ0_9BACT|nr:hypothetical protein [Granulicella arctica]NYF79492.1 hypothetical protein [Granulicella arctica]
MSTPLKIRAGALLLFGCSFVAHAQTAATAQAVVPNTETLSPAETPVAAGLNTARNFISPVSTNGDFPRLQPWNFINTVSQRFAHNDVIGGMSITVNYQHGGGNFMGADTWLKPKTVAGSFENGIILDLNSVSNTDIQNGGALGMSNVHYGHGDNVLFAAENTSTGISRGTDEGNKLFRVFSQFHGNNYGIVIQTLTTDAMGEAILTAPKELNGSPRASPGHDLKASMENGPLINTNPAKIYAQGNVADIEKCPATLLNSTFYMCVDGDTATNWTGRYGISRMTQLTADLADTPGPNPFAAGPVCADVPVTDSSIFTRGATFTISSGGDNFEQPTVLSVGRGTIHACFAKPHAAGEMLTTGGAVGHALSMANDDMAPQTVPGFGNSNASTLRLAYPIVASLANNRIVVWVDAAVTPGVELKTRAFDANTPRVPASFTPKLDPVSHGIANWSIASHGDYHTNSKTNTGADFLPPPAIDFTGSVCTTMPVAHTVYVPINNHELTVSPVTDQPGNCSSLKMQIQSTYPNPVSIYPMLWARSNRDPAFTTDPKSIAYLQQFGITASTDGYMVAGGTSSEFAVGDPVEFGYWWQQYLDSDIEMSTWMGKSGRYGEYFTMGFNGVQGNQPMFALNNRTPLSDYYGVLSADGKSYVPGLHGEGRMSPPIGFRSKGPVQTAYQTSYPTARLGNTATPAAVRVLCDAGPCTQGIWTPYDLFDGQGPDGDFVGFRYDPATHSTSYFGNRNSVFGVPGGVRTMSVLANSPGDAVSIDDTALNDGKGRLTAGTVTIHGAASATCGTGSRGMLNFVPGAAGVADTVEICTKDAADRYAWRALPLTSPAAR